MTDFSKMTDEEFDVSLRQIINEECCAEDLLRIPGIYEILSDHFNNEILSRWESEQEEFDDEVLCFDDDDHNYTFLTGDVNVQDY